MIGDIYLKQTVKRDKLIKKLFEDIARETIGPENLNRVKFDLIYTRRGCNWCKSYEDGNFKIEIEFYAIERRTSNGYEDCYYPNRKLRVDKYVIHNRHNAIRFALYHELKHCADRLNNPIEETSEFDADGWAIKHLEGVK